MQLIGAATAYVPNQTPMPQQSKQLLNACPVPPMDIIVTLLAGCQSAVPSSNEWHNDMNPAFISTICNGTDPLLLICDILQCFFKITQIVELLASS